MSARLLLVLMLAPLGGCWWLVSPCGGDGSCARPQPVRDGLYAVDGGGREDMVSGDLEVAGDEVFVTYVDTEGHTWEVRYTVVDRYPNRSE